MSKSWGMGKKEERDVKENASTSVEAVLKLLRKQAPLTLEQEKFCNKARVERFLKVEGDNVKKATKHLRACFSWRESFGTENLIADEFPAEIAEGLAYVAGHDEESRPVLVFRIKQDYRKFHSQKMFTRLVVFTLEVASGTMSKNVDQFVIIFDASFFRSASGFMNILVPTLKIVGEYYPAQLYKAFVVDPPSLFSYLWKGVRPFVELSTAIMLVSSSDFDESFEFNDFSSYPRTPSVRSNHSSRTPRAKIGSSASSRFSFTVSHHFDSVKPWYLSLTDTSGFKVGPTSPSPLGSAFISPVNARSLSFESPSDRFLRGEINGRKSLFPSTPLPERSTSCEDSKISKAWTPRPSFLQSPAVFFRKECRVSKTEKSREAFYPFLKFYRRPYDEMVYRSKMRPPLGGLISIVSHRIRPRHVSASQRF